MGAAAAGEDCAELARWREPQSWQCFPCLQLLEGTIQLVGGHQGNGIDSPSIISNPPFPFPSPLPSLSFSQPGVSGANIQAGFVSRNGEGIVLAASAAQGLRGVAISHVSVTQVRRGGLGCCGSAVPV